MAIKTTKTNPRFYFDTVDPDRRYPGVTSVVGMLPKPFLQRWNANMAADRALDSIPFITEMAAVSREDAKRYIAGAAYAYTKERGAVGTAAHDLFERLIRGETLGAHLAPGMRPYHDQFAQWLNDVQPELIRAEDVAWSDTHEYAGSFDAILRVRLDENGKPDPAGEPAVVMTDYKTSKSTYPEVALQMAAYAHADKIIAADGTEHSMPVFDGGAVLHITAEAAEFTPVVISEEVFGHFVHLRSTFRWDREVSKRVLGDPIWRSGGPVTGTARRAQ